MPWCLAERYIFRWYWLFTTALDHCCWLWLSSMFTIWPFIIKVSVNYPVPTASYRCVCSKRRSACTCSAEPPKIVPRLCILHRCMILRVSMQKLLTKAGEISVCCECKHRSFSVSANFKLLSGRKQAFFNVPCKTMEVYFRLPTQYLYK